jgi:glycosyltransferase involved in cell wall biosynthesis
VNGQPLKVGYVVKRYPRYSETFIVNEILAHEAAGLDVEIFSLRLPEEPHFQSGIARVRAPVTYLTGGTARNSDFWGALLRAAEAIPGLWSSLEAARSEPAGAVYQALLLAHHVRTRGINHLHAHFATAASSVSRLAARFAGISYSLTAHAKDIFHSNVDREGLRRKMEEAAAVITVSEYNLKYLRETYGPAAARAIRIYNGVDLGALPYGDHDLRREEVVAVGRLVEKKGFGDLLEACALLAQRGRPVRCQIIGTGELEPVLHARLEQLGLQDLVSLEGALPYDEMIRRVGQATVFAAPSVVAADGDRDGLPTVLLEAMSLGTPCVSTDVAGIPEVVRPWETGLLVPQGDPAALSEAIECLLDDRALRTQLARRARALVEAECDIHRNARRMREIFQGACEWHVQKLTEMG